MSKNTEQYQLITPSSSSTKRLQTSTDFNTPSSPQSYTSPIVSDVCANNQNGVRNASTTMKINNMISPNGNHFNDNKYAFTLEFSPPVTKSKKDSNRTIKTQLFPFDMATNNEEDLHSPFELDVPLCENPSLKKVQNDFLIDRMLKDDQNSHLSSQQRSPNQSSYTNILNHASPLLTPSSDHHDIDALSDAGTYIIEDDIDIAHDDEPSEQDTEPQNDTKEQQTIATVPSSFRRYATTKKNRHGTFEIHPITSPTSSTNSQTVNRPVVDLNVPTHDLSSPSSSTSSPSSSANISSSSSLLSLPTESDNSIRKEPEGASQFTINDKSSTGLIYARQRPNSLSQQTRSVTPPQNQIKPSECFVISPTFESKPFPNTTRRKTDSQWKPKSTTSVVPTKDINYEIPSKKSPPSSPRSIRSNQSDKESFSFRLQQTRHHEPKQQPSSSSSASNQNSSLQTSDYLISSSKSSLRSQPSTNDSIYSSSPFQRNTTVRQTMPPNTQYNRPMSSSTIASSSSSTTTTTTAATNKYPDDNEDILSTHPSLTKVYMNKSFALRRQRSNLVPSTSKPVQQPPPPPSSQQQQTMSKALPTRQPIKPTASIPSTSFVMNNSSGQTNRAVELRRARAQAKIEELSQRTRQQLQKTEHHNDIMSASWHSNASSTGKKDYSNVRSKIRPTTNTNQLTIQKQDLLKTRTISSSSSTHHRSSSASPNPLGETTTTTNVSKYRRPMTTSVTDETQYQKMNGSTYGEEGQCDSLRDDGQRLAIKLIQLSSGILAKLKPSNTTNDNDSNVRELQQLVDQLQTVNRTLSNIDASLTNATSDEHLL